MQSEGRRWYSWRATGKRYSEPHDVADTGSLPQSSGTMENIKNQLSSNAASYFGILPSSEASMQKWTNRRLRHCSRRYGGVREDAQAGLETVDGLFNRVRDPLAVGRSHSTKSTGAHIGRSFSTDSRTSKVRVLRRRESAAKLAWDKLNTLIRSGSTTDRSSVLRTRPTSRSVYPIQSNRDFAIADFENISSPEHLGPPSSGEADTLQMATISEEGVISQPFTSNLLQSSTLEQEATAFLKDESPLQDEVFYDFVAPPIDFYARNDGIRFNFATVTNATVPLNEGFDVVDGVTIGSKLHSVKPSSKIGAMQRCCGNIWRLVLSTISSERGRRRIFGEGVVGHFLGRTLRRRSELSPHVVQQLDDFDDYRPFFTYWITTVQILVMVIALITYGFGPVGFWRTHYSAMILQPSLVLEYVAYFEQENFLIGPRFADLVHLGAKYAPCMRRDLNIYSVIEENRRLENQSACCIFNDQSGCVQTSVDRCPQLLAQSYKWTPDNPGPNGRVSGAVCGQDPRTCRIPSSISPLEWPDDITRWPICKESNPTTTLRHLTCEITGRPCCVGIQGECRITTREYCDFVRGYFHEEATLCSQVSCLGEVCGMVPFLNSDHPDQLSRFVVPLFLHGGILHCLVTVFIQHFLLRDLEKLIGWSRVCIIYMVSGIGGYLGSAVFVPYQAEVGPAGSQFGLLAGLIIDVIYSWKMIARPWKALCQLVGFVLFLFLIGLLPWIDNYAHAFGFIFGFLLSLALFPYIQFEKNDRRKRLIIVCTSLSMCGSLMTVLFVFFYINPLWTCQNCIYFNCIPFTDHLCDNRGLQLNLHPL